jgi:hypothetical protein
MRPNLIAVGMCVAAAVALAGSTVQAAAAPAGQAGSHANGVRPRGHAASVPSPGGVITGVVLGASGRPLAGACVTATLEAGVAAGVSPAGAARNMKARTFAGGRYFFGGLKAGRYSLRYHTCAHQGGLSNAIGQAVVSGGQIVRLAPVTLRQPRLGGSSTRPGPALPAHTGIRRPAGHRLTVAGLRRLARRSGIGGISGRVTNAAGRPVKGICVNAHFRTGYVGVETSAQGTYNFGKSLPAGRYTVQFGLCDFGKSAGNWAPQWYHGKYRQAHANPVTVRAGKIYPGH